MKRLIIVLLVLTAGMQYLDAQTKEDKDLIINQIQVNDRKLESFFEKGLTDSIAELFSPNSQMASEFNVMIEDRENIQLYYSKEKKSGKKILDYSLKAIEHKVYDEIVLEIGTNTVKYSIGADKRLYTTDYNYMLVWKKSKSGDYQIRAAMWNLSADPCSK